MKSKRKFSLEFKMELAEKAKSGCPVSQALAGTQILLKAKLV